MHRLRHAPDFFDWLPVMAVAFVICSAVILNYVNKRWRP